MKLKLLYSYDFIVFFCLTSSFGFHRVGIKKKKKKKAFHEFAAKNETDVMAVQSIVRPLMARLLQVEHWHSIISLKEINV